MQLRRGHLYQGGTTLRYPTRGRWLVVVSMVALMMLGAGDSGQRFETLGHKLMCTCGCNQILLECNHVGCPVSGGMRDELSAGLTRGDSNDLVLQGFVQKYGPIVLAAPTTIGFNRVAWIMPFAVFVLGIGLVMFIVRNWRLRGPSMPVSAHGISGGEMAHHFEALRKRAREETEL